jgi:N-acetylmuramoyl-L-alanine amidase
MKMACYLKSLLLKAEKKLVLIFLFISFLPITSFLPKLFPFGIKKVVIDAGHGGHDPGCLGAHSKEKEVALGVSLKLGKLIEDNLKDVEVIYTRKVDKFVELRERANIANKNKADLFICIHCNSGPPAAYGAETYVMGLRKSKENLAVAKRENSAILLEKDYEKNYDGFDPNSDEANIMFSLYQSAFLDQSLNFAAKVQNQFKEKAKRHDRGVKQEGFLVLYMTTMPSVLIETGFLTNRNEEDFLATEEGQNLMAQSIYYAFKEYKYEVDGKKSPLIIAEDPKKTNSEKDATAEKTADVPAKQVVNQKDRKPAEVKAKEISQKENNQLEGIIFRIQIATSSTQIDPLPENFKGINGVLSFKSGGIYRYAVGEERTFESAKKLQEEIKSKGYADAFIISFKNGERIPVSEAIKELNP